MTATTWYVRRRREVKGPFPDALIARFVLNGKIRDTDELSKDMQSWQSFALVRRRFEGVEPSAPAIEAFGAAGRGAEAASPRIGQVPERRNAVPAGGARRPPAGARRAHSGARRLVDEYATRYRASHGRRAAELAILGVLIAAIAATGVLLAPSDSASSPDCEALPAPEVNWSNCRIERLTAPQADLAGANLRNAKLRAAKLTGARLRTADLAYAELVGAGLSYSDLHGASLLGANLQNANLAYANLSAADLAYADLRGANLGETALEGARLDFAIWTDGRTCAARSHGGCR